MRLTVLCLAVAILIFTGANDVLGQSQALQSKYQKLDEQVSIYLGLQGNLYDIGMARPEESRYRSLALIYISCSQRAMLYVGAAADLLRLYDLITNENNKKTAIPVINERLRFYLSNLDGEIKTVSNNLPWAKSYDKEIYDKGLRLRDELYQSNKQLKAAVIK